MTVASHLLPRTDIRSLSKYARLDMISLTLWAWTERTRIVAWLVLRLGMAPGLAAPVSLPRPRCRGLAGVASGGAGHILCGCQPRDL